MISACTLKRGALFQDLCLIPKNKLYRTSPASITPEIIHHCVYLCIYSSLIMGLRRSPGGVKVCTLPGKTGLGFDSRVRTPFSLYHCCIYLVFTFVYIVLSACTHRRGALFQALCLIPKNNPNRTSPASITP